MNQGHIHGALLDIIVNLSHIFFVLLFVSFRAIPGYAQGLLLLAPCSGITLRLREPYECLVGPLNLGQPCARQVPNPLYYHSDPLSHMLTYLQAPSQDGGSKHQSQSVIPVSWVSVLSDLSPSWCCPAFIHWQVECALWWRSQLLLHWGFGRAEWKLRGCLPVQTHPGLHKSGTHPWKGVPRMSGHCFLASPYSVCV